MNQDLNENWNLLNQNYDKDILLATLLNKGASFGVLYQDPKYFKYMSDVWFAKHYRTFEKWFTAFDIPYSPLENYNRKDTTIEKVNEDSNKYNKFNNRDTITDNHIGDSFSNEDLDDKTTKHYEQNETMDDDTTKAFESAEVTDKDITNNTIGSNDGRTHNEGDSNYIDHAESERNIQVDTAFDHTDKTSFTNRETTRTPSLQTETRVSAYNAGDKLYDEDTSQDPPVPNKKAPYYEAYAPSELVLNNGSEKTKQSGDESINHKTNNEDGANRVITKDTYEEDKKGAEAHSDDGTSHNEYDESNVGSEDQTVRFSSNEKGTDDRTTDTSYDDNTTDIRNIQTKSNDKYINNSNGKHVGDSQEKANVDRDTETTQYAHGNIGVTTSQDMLNQEIKVQMFTIYDQMAELFVDEMCVRIYLSNRQRGGCCWW